MILINEEAFSPVAPNTLLLDEKPAYYATKVEGRSPRVKFHTKRTARNAVQYHFGGGYKDTPHRAWTSVPQPPSVALYKLGLFGERLLYVPIFDSQSDLAHAVVDGRVTLKQALEHLDWDVNVA